jgi:hypothetical protein
VHARFLHKRFQDKSFERFNTLQQHEIATRKYVFQKSIIDSCVGLAVNESEQTGHRRVFSRVSRSQYYEREHNNKTKLKLTITES